MECQINCKVHDKNKVITHVGLFGLTSKYTPLEIAAMIERGDTFYTFENNRRAEVHARQHPKTGRIFLTTDPDGVDENNLDFLPECS